MDAGDDSDGEHHSGAPNRGQGPFREGGIGSGKKNWNYDLRFWGLGILDFLNFVPARSSPFGTDKRSQILLKLSCFRIEVKNDERKQQTHETKAHLMREQWVALRQRRGMGSGSNGGTTGEKKGEMVF